MNLKHSLQILLANKYITPASLAAIAVFTITFVALYIPPYIGMADNGDYFRILYSNGIYFSNPNYDNYYLGYFIKEYGLFQYFNENQTMLISSQIIFIKLAIFINKLFYSDSTFDIRFQSAIFLVLYTVTIYYFVAALTSKLTKNRGYIVSLIVVIVFADTGYTAYFNSFFSESIVLIFLLLFTTFCYFLYLKRYNDYWLLVLIMISGIFLTTSKQQNAPIGIIIAVVGIFLLILYKPLTKKLLVMATMSILFFTGVFTYAAISDEFENINKIHAMTRGVLMSSPNPESTLDNFDIENQYTILNGDIYYLPFTTIDVNSDLLIENFYSKYNFVDILRYYITHPNQASKMLDLAAKNGFTIRPPAMGNYELSAGKEFGAQTKFFSAYSILKNKLAPKTFGFVIIWASIVIGIFLPNFVRGIKTKRYHEILGFPLVFVLLLFAFSAMAVSILGAGDADLSKHQFLFTVSFDVITIITIAEMMKNKSTKSK